MTQPSKPKRRRPRSAEFRTLPPDAKSLEEMIRSVHKHVLDRAEHLKQNSHDVHARRGFQTLYEQRARAFTRLMEIDAHRCEQLRLELGLHFSQPSQTEMV